MKPEHYNLPGYETLLPDEPLTDNLAVSGAQYALSTPGAYEPDEYKLFRQVRSLVPYAKVKVVTEAT
jgi:hypothetical protein